MNDIQHVYRGTKFSEKLNGFFYWQHFEIITVQLLSIKHWHRFGFSFLILVRYKCHILNKIFLDFSRGKMYPSGFGFLFLRNFNTLAISIWKQWNRNAIEDNQKYWKICRRINSSIPKTVSKYEYTNMVRQIQTRKCQMIEAWIWFYVNDDYNNRIKRKWIILSSNHYSYRKTKIARSHTLLCSVKIKSEREREGGSRNNHV